MLSSYFCRALFIVGLVSAFSIRKVHNTRFIAKSLNGFSPRFNKNILLASTNTDTDPWVIDIDSAELNCQSSASLARLKEAEARRIFEEQERKRLEEEMRIAEQQKLELEKKLAAEREKELENERTQQSKSKEVAVINTISPPATEEKIALPQVQSGFDLGLAILFPVMIGTLLLFLFFPMYAAQFASSSPPST